jgi:anti-anti-sigma regulatory factor
MTRSQAGLLADVDVVNAAVHVRGPLRRPGVSCLLGSVEILLQTGHRELTVDLRQVPYIDGAAVQALAVPQHDLWAHGGRLTLVNASPCVHQQLIAGQVACPGAPDGSR